MIDWPSQIPFTSEDLHLAGATITSQGVFGPGTVINVENRVWAVELGLPHLERDQWRLLRAVLDEARGQYGVIRVPFQSWLNIGALPGPVSFEGGLTFDGGITFGAETESAIAVAAVAPAGATQIVASPVLNGILQVGALIGLPNDRAYRIAAVSGDLVTINPPLRDAVAVGDRIDIEMPVLGMRLTVDDAAVTRRAADLASPLKLTLVEAL